MIVPDNIQIAFTLLHAADARRVIAARNMSDNLAAYREAKLTEDALAARLGDLVSDWLLDANLVELDDEEIAKLAAMPPEIAAANLELARSVNVPKLRVAR
jgi:hypothetical protein